jgi:hypothetical protein
VHGRVLEARLDHGRAFRAEHLQQCAVDRHADECDDLRPEAIDLLFEHVPALDVLRRTEPVDARARARNQVRHPEAPLRKPHVLAVREPLRHKARFEQQSPEPVGRAGEMMPRLGRLDARIDADQQHAHARRDAISEAKVLPGGSRMLAHDL